MTKTCQINASTIFKHSILFQNVEFIQWLMFFFGRMYIQTHVQSPFHYQMLQSEKQNNNLPDLKYKNNSKYLKHFRVKYIWKW